MSTPATAAAVKTRLYVDAPLAEGAAIGLDHERAHFLRHVLRLEPGDKVAVFNGRDGEWTARIDGFGKGWCSLAAEELRRAQDAAPDLWLAFAPIKKGRIDMIAEKACELGVSRLLPVFTRHTDPNRVNTDRLAANAVEAAEQCERLSVPEVAQPQQLFQMLADWPADRALIALAETGAAEPLAAVAGRLKGRKVGFLVGPEGGFAQMELDELARHPSCVAAGLGPRVLRAETAVFAALAVGQALAGDWTLAGSDARPPNRAVAMSPTA